LGLLFDGPEYGDVNEKAQITATYLDGTKHSITFTATGKDSGVLTGAGSFESLSEAKDGKGGVWGINNPFGNIRVTSLTFTALSGVCGTTGGACSNQSDYTLISVSAVPEPETYAMMLLGLLGIGFISRRNKQV
jgi:hypothetical protein